MFKGPVSVRFLYFSAHPASTITFPQAYCRLNVVPSPTTDCTFLTKFTSLTPRSSLFICPNLRFVCTSFSLSLLSSALALFFCPSRLHDWLSWPPADAAPGYLPPGGPGWIVPYNKHKSVFSSLITCMCQRCFYCSKCTVVIKGVAARRSGSVKVLMQLQELRTWESQHGCFPVYVCTASSDYEVT